MSENDNNKSFSQHYYERITDTMGIVTYVDEETAFFDIHHPKLGNSSSKATMSGDVFRRSTGFGDVVKELDDFLSFSDKVMLDVEKELFSSSPSSSPSLSSSSSLSSSPSSSSPSPSSSLTSFETIWRVTRVTLIPEQRPVRYGSVAEYVSRSNPSGWPEQKRCHIPPRSWGELVTTMADVLRAWSRVPVDLFREIASGRAHHHHHHDDRKLHNQQDHRHHDQQNNTKCQQHQDRHHHHHQQQDDDHDNHNYDFREAFDSYVKTDGDLLSFVRTVPQHFFVDDRMRICSYSAFDETEFETEIAKLCKELPKKNKKYSLESLLVISDVEESITVLKTMLKRARKRQSKGESPGMVVALDCVVVKSGKRNELSVVQLASMTGVVYLFDVLQCPRLVGDGLLGEVLESDAILKVIHDCSLLASSLFQQFHVVLNSVFDTAIVYRVLQDQCSVSNRNQTERVSLWKVCQMLGEEIVGGKIMAQEQDSLKKVEKEKEEEKKESEREKQKEVRQTESAGSDIIKGRNSYCRKILTERPLTDEVITYAASRVYHLVPNVYKTLQRLVHLNWRGVVKDRCEDTIRECTVEDRDYTKFNQRQ